MALLWASVKTLELTIRFLLFQQTSVVIRCDGCSCSHHRTTAGLRFDI